MNLQQLRVFLKVAELEHITHASEDLGFSQPAVTKMVQSLEQEIGLELIRRRKKGVALFLDSMCIPNCILSDGQRNSFHEWLTHFAQCYAW
jgi:regulatory helix-turn-helix LysR family protein